MIGVILLAAGRGERVGNTTAKQFLALRGRPVYQHALIHYASAGLVDRIALVVPRSAVGEVTDAVETLQPGLPIAVCAGGDTRDLSIRAGLSALDDLGDPDSYQQLILHNAASPNTDTGTIARCLAALDQDQVAQACLPETRTQFIADGAHATSMLPRAAIVTSCDPTAFRAGALRRLLDYKQAQGLANDTTTDTALNLGYGVALVPSHAGNIKLTGPWDLALLNAAMAGSAATECEPT